MKSATLPSFWKSYHVLGKSIQRRAKKAFTLWTDDPFYPSLHLADRKEMMCGRIGATGKRSVCETE
jgi:hypothetical protein